MSKESNLKKAINEMDDFLKGIKNTSFSKEQKATLRKKGLETRKGMMNALNRLSRR